MKKPKPKTKIVKRLDYHECEDYIESKLGYNLRDVDGKFADGKCYDDRAYKDFWHFIVDACDVHNGCEIFMPSEDCADEEWQAVILRAFHEEFGEGPYWVAW